MQRPAWEVPISILFSVSWFIWRNAGNILIFVHDGTGKMDYQIRLAFIIKVAHIMPAYFVTNGSIARSVLEKQLYLE